MSCIWFGLVENQLTNWGSPPPPLPPFGQFPKENTFKCAEGAAVTLCRRQKHKVQKHSKVKEREKEQERELFGGRGSSWYRPCFSITASPVSAYQLLRSANNQKQYSKANQNAWSYDEIIKTANKQAHPILSKAWGLGLRKECFCWLSLLAGSVGLIWTVLILKRLAESTISMSWWEQRRRRRNWRLWKAVEIKALLPLSLLPQGFSGQIPVVDCWAARQL